MNSISNIEKRLHDLLKDTKPKIIAIKGKWGTGKTYFWKDFIKRKIKNIALKKYAYVSLFGVKELMQLKREIFVNSGNSQTASTLKKHTPAIKTVGATFFDKISSQIPLIKEVGINFGAIGNIIETSLINNIKDILICVVDLERRHDGITLSEILGFFTNLRDERNCQIVLLFNEEALENDNDDTRKIFREYREKVIDYEFSFSPKIEEIYKIVFEKLEFNLEPVQNQYGAIETKTISEMLDNFKLSNFRVIEKIKNALLYFRQEKIEERFPKLWPRLARQIVTLCTIYYAEGHVINFADFVNEENNRKLTVREMRKDKNVEESIKPSSQVRKKYDYLFNGEDVVVKEYLENGFVDFDACRDLLNNLESQLDDLEIQREHRKAWDVLWANFQHSSADFIDAQLDFMEKYKGKISLESLQQVPEIAREFLPDCPGKEEAVAKIEQHWKNAAIAFAQALPLDKRNNYKDNFPSFSKETFSIIDEELSKDKKEKSLPEIIALLTGFGDSWNPSDLEYLKGRTSEEFYKWIKECTDKKLIKSILPLIQERLLMETEPRQIAKNFSTALGRISKESQINMRRVKVGIYHDYSYPATKE
jgi:hypothetical protein